MLKKCKVVMLPTNEKAPINNNVIILCHNAITNKPLRYGKKVQESFNIYAPEQHLYITSSDEIKLSSDNNGWFIRKHSFTELEDIVQNPNFTSEYKFKKIIATTDSSLKIEIFGLGETAMCSLPQPSQSFIEKYVEEYNKGNAITDVMVEYYGKWNPNCGFHFNLEGKLKVNLKKDNTITIKKVKESWDRDEVVELIYNFAYDLTEKRKTATSYQRYDKWIEENLKTKKL